MGLPSAGGKTFQGSPPDKGSFPLDHDGECKPHKENYMACLRKTGNDSRPCRELSKLYLECRMAAQLMAREDWKHLGFKDSAQEAAAACPADKLEKKMGK
eukprot:gene16187-35109_t